MRKIIKIYLYSSMLCSLACTSSLHTIKDVMGHQHSYTSFDHCWELPADQGVLKIFDMAFTEGPSPQTLEYAWDRRSRPFVRWIAWKKDDPEVLVTLKFQDDEEFLSWFVSPKEGPFVLTKVYVEAEVKLHLHRLAAPKTVEFEIEDFEGDVIASAQNSDAFFFVLERYHEDSSIIEVIKLSHRSSPPQIQRVIVASGEQSYGLRPLTSPLRYRNKVVWVTKPAEDPRKFEVSSLNFKMKVVSALIPSDPKSTSELSVLQFINPQPDRFFLSLFEGDSSLDTGTYGYMFWDGAQRLQRSQLSESIYDRLGMGLLAATKRGRLRTMHVRQIEDQSYLQTLVEGRGRFVSSGPLRKLPQASLSIVDAIEAKGRRGWSYIFRGIDDKDLWYLCTAMESDSVQ